MNDFKLLLRFNQSQFWMLDKQLREILSNINSNPKIQSLYSKKYDNKSGNLFKESYLHLGFFNSMRQPLDELILTLDNKYRDFTNTKFRKGIISKEKVLRCSINDPLENTNYIHSNSDSPLGCIRNPNYFRIFHIEFELKSSKEHLHEMFWNDLNENLKKLQ